MPNLFGDFQLIKSRNIAIRVGEQRLLFDPTNIPKRWRSTKTTICISHAHSDHTAGFNNNLLKIVTPETLELYASTSKKPGKVHTMQLGKDYELPDGGTVKLHPAGHMLGAAQFVVEKNGSVTDVKVLRGIGGGCDEEAIRVVKNMPKWTPGKQRGKPVRVQFNLPVKFTLQ